MLVVVFWVGYVIYCVMLCGVGGLACMGIVRKKRVIMRTYTCLVMGRVLCVAMYGVVISNNFVDSLLYRKKTIQHIRYRDHL